MHPAVAKFRQLPNLTSQRDWQSASAVARSKAQNRNVIVKHLLCNGSLDQALTKLEEALNTGLISPALSQAISSIGKLPSRATIYNWVSAYKDQGLEGLLPNHKGKTAKQPDWALRALELYHSPNSPSFAQVADQLVTEKYKAEAFQVRRFINSLPHELGPQSPYRMGSKLYREKHKDFLIRSTEHIPPGFLYNADGHTLDVYLAHPNTGKAWRAELTAFQDVASRCIVGWEISEAENTISTLTALTRSINDHQHVPSMLYIDNGSGYKAKMMADDGCGVYAQFDLEVIFAIPGNARAKWIERFFKHMEERVGKRFATYCGRGHDERHKQLMLKEVKQGKRELPSVDEWIAEFKDFLDDYHNSEHPEIKGKTRLQVWQDGLIQEKPHCSDFTILPREVVNVRRGRVRLHKRDYAANFLHQFNGQELVAGYDLHDDTYINLYEKTGEFIMLCELKNKVQAIPQSRIDEVQQKRLAGQTKRLERHLAEKKARAAVTQIVDVDSIENLSHNTSMLIEEQETQVFDFDIADFDTTESERKPLDPELFLNAE